MVRRMTPARGAVLGVVRRDRRRDLPAAWRARARRQPLTASALFGAWRRSRVVVFATRQRLGPVIPVRHISSPTRLAPIRSPQPLARIPASVVGNGSRVATENSWHGVTTATEPNG